MSPPESESGGLFTTRSLALRPDATITCVPFAPTLLDEAGHVSGLAWIVYLGAMPTALGFATWSFALSRASAGRVASLNYLIPVVAIAATKPRIQTMFPSSPSFRLVEGVGTAVVPTAIDRGCTQVNPVAFSPALGTRFRAAPGLVLDRLPTFPA